MRKKKLTTGRLKRHDLLTGIIHTSIPQPITGNQFLKYRNIPDNAHKIANFATFAKKFPGADYINFYHQDNNAFKERLYLE